MIVIKKLLTHCGGFWLNQCGSNWVIYYCHHKVGVIHLLYLLERCLSIEVLWCSGVVLRDFLSMSPDHLAEQNRFVCTVPEQFII